jgi:hypothetical protein
MGADRRPRPHRLMGLGAALVVLVALGLNPPALGAKTPRSGSSCAHPAVVTLRRGQRFAYYQHQSIIDAEYRHLTPGVNAIVGWYGCSNRDEENDIICSARIQRRDGSWVGPTRLRPYPALGHAR